MFPKELNTNHKTKNTQVQLGVLWHLGREIILGFHYDENHFGWHTLQTIGISGI